MITEYNAAIAKALQSPELVKRLREQGAEPAASTTPQQFREFVRSESARFRKIVTDGQIRAE